MNEDRYKKYKIALFSNIAIFNPKGLIASEQRDIIIRALLLMLIAVVPILIMTFLFAWKYRAGKNSNYEPNFDHSRPLQITWVALLSAIVVILAVMAWNGSHELDPRKPLASDVNPITIQVVAMQWKWLFIYPEQNIATVNLVQFPEDTPVNLEITADAPMNALLIPELGGQMYAMNGMKTTLHLMANEIGTYRGFSSNISGEGFSGMTFAVHATSGEDFSTWVSSVKKSQKHLTTSEYNVLSKPTKNHAQVTYASTDSDLFNNIVMKFMATGTTVHHH